VTDGSALEGLFLARHAASGRRCLAAEPGPDLLGIRMLQVLQDVQRRAEGGVLVGRCWRRIQAAGGWLPGGPSDRSRHSGRFLSAGSPGWGVAGTGSVAGEVGWGVRVGLCL
jgi:hypothetical protein